jgi:dipeptidyl-peptidase-4
MGYKSTLWLFFFLLGCLFAQSEYKKLSMAVITSSDIFMPASISSIYWSAEQPLLHFRDERSNKFFTYTIANDSLLELLDVHDLSGCRQFSTTHFANGIWSHNGRLLLFTEQIRAREMKTGGNFLLYNLKEKKIKQLTDTDESQLNVLFSPDDRNIVFVRSNNLYILDIEQSQEKQLTFDGQKGVRNGHFDWVYEEEFSIIQGWQWSPDANYLAFWQIDERDEPEYSITEYDSLYLNWNRMHYPKAGSMNAKVRIGVVNTNTAELVWIDTGNDRDIYIPRIYWMPHTRELLVFRLNRLQNKIEILLANILTGKSRIIFRESDAKWLEITDDFKIINQGKDFLWTSEKDGFRHIYLYSITSQKEKQITKGEWEVRELLAVDEKAQWIYFTATKKSPRENHLYRIDFKGNQLKQLTERSGWHEIAMSPDCKYFIDTHSAFDTMPNIYVSDNTGQELTLLSGNSPEEYREFRLEKPENITIKGETGIELNGWILKPPDFSEGKRYPLLLFVYGGPGSQEAVDQWHFFNLWHQYLVQHGYLVACIDNRGTGGKGGAFKKTVYKRLGQLEAADQIAAAAHFACMSYIDANRIGIWGWSYGGYLSTFCLFRGKGVFKTAVAVAPVTDWHFYDTVYTERYMQTPELNPAGYRESSLLNFAQELSGNYLVIHGTSDDNVHFQNTVVLAEKLITYHKQFRVMFYPGRYHSIQNITEDTREHLFTLISDFIFDNL